MKHVRLLLPMLLLLFSFPIFCEEITFEGGYTKMTTKDGKKEIVLSGGAEVTTSSLKLAAQNITLGGTDYDVITLSGNVTVTDEQKGLTVRSPSIEYVRSTGTITIQGWVEIEDTSNAISASAGGLLYDMNKGTMKMQAHVRLLRAASKGVMTCTCDELSYDREKKTLELTGSAVIDWQGDLYQAHVISVDLDSENIVLEGAIQGTVHG
ncbi:MAG: LptA/OstA family protein [Sphaerochaetaceae bacterium]